MSCPFREEVDLARYLTEPSAGEFDAFRAHYPGCAVCAAEVALWTGIEATLAEPSEGAGAESRLGHPDVEALARYAGSPDARGPEQVAMQRHLDACPTCRTEWRALQSFDFAAAADAPWGAGAASPEPAAKSALDRIASWLGLDRPPRLAGVGAFAVVLIALVTWVAIGPEPGRRTGPGEPAIASRMETAPTAVDESLAPPPMPAPQPPTAPLASGSAEAGALAAAEAPASTGAAPAPAVAVDPAPSPPAAQPEAPMIQLAEADLDPGAGRAVPAIDDESEEEPRAGAAVRGSESGSEAILLASLSQMAPPDYVVPSGSSELTWMHQFGSVRGIRGGETDLRVTAHAPDHVGLTQVASPRLWWSVSEPATQDVVITVVDDREIDPVLEVVRPGPHAAGLSSISLADHGVVLEPGVEYRWFVTLVNDPERPSRNPVSAGSIRRLASSPAERDAIASAPPAERGHELARRGYWYDSYDFFADLEARHPQVAELADHRERLLAAGHAME